jgi:hypothetical protein
MWVDICTVLSECVTWLHITTFIKIHNLINFAPRITGTQLNIIKKNVFSKTRHTANLCVIFEGEKIFHRPRYKVG